MRVVVQTSVFAVTMLVGQVGAQQTREDEAALIKASNEVWNAMQSRDEATLRRRLAEDFIMVHTNGAAIDTRDRFLSFLKSGSSTPRSQVTTYDTVVRPISPGVVLMTETANLREGTISRWFTATSVWRNKSGDWQVVYGHRALIAEGIVETDESVAAYNRITGRYKTSDGREISVVKQGARLLMRGPRAPEREDVMVPQGNLEFAVTFYRLAFSADGTPVSATATSNGRVLWKAVKQP
jgi:ketosteroid isomerase-like protein